MEDCMIKIQLLFFVHSHSYGWNYNSISFSKLRFYSLDHVFHKYAVVVVYGKVPGSLLSAVSVSELGCIHVFLYTSRISNNIQPRKFVYIT